MASIKDLQKKSTFVFKLNQVAKTPIMNIAYTVSIISVLLLLVFAILSFTNTNNPRFQLLYIVVATFNIGVLVSIILVNYSAQSALIWPALLFIHVINKVRELYKLLS
jgi:hypothetical protein